MEPTFAPTVSHDIPGGFHGYERFGVAIMPSRPIINLVTAGPSDTEVAISILKEAKLGETIQFKDCTIQKRKAKNGTIVYRWHKPGGVYIWFDLETRGNGEGNKN